MSSTALYRRCLFAYCLWLNILPVKTRVTKTVNDPSEQGRSWGAGKLSCCKNGIDQHLGWIRSLHLHVTVSFASWRLLSLFFTVTAQARRERPKLSSLGNVNGRLRNCAEPFWARTQSTRWRFGRQLCYISPLHVLQNLARPSKLMRHLSHKQAFALPESTRVELHLWVPGHTASRRKVP